MKVLKRSQALALYNDSITEREDYEVEWRAVSRYLLPARGVWNRTSKPRKRRVTNSAVVNPEAEDALYVLTSGFHGALTSPSRPWFRLDWSDSKVKEVEELKAWLQECERRMHAALQQSNFYPAIESAYIEIAGFGINSMFIGSNNDGTDIPFYFEPLTAGEYSYAYGKLGQLAVYCRVIFMSQRQIVSTYKKAPRKLKNRVKLNASGVDIVDRSILEIILQGEGDKPFKRFTYLLEDEKGFTSSEAPLASESFYEMPYVVGRWSSVARDTYALGPGVRAIPSVKSLQEVEKSIYMAAHKMVDPPTMAPATLRGKLNTLPGGKNYYMNPNDKIESLYNFRFDIQGAAAVADRISKRITNIFYNDIFLTGSRDPNASPYKATEVQAREQEKMLRLGPVVERLQHEFLKPIVERCFNIMLRGGYFPELNPALAKMAGAYNISIVSPLATAQRAVALQGITSFLSFIGQAAQFKPDIMDNVDVDEAARDFGDITGVRYGILRPESAVKEIRATRAKMQAQQMAKEEAMAQAQAQSQQEVQKAQATKAQAEAGATLIEGQKNATEAGIL